ncbi:MAG: hypothetical protein BGO11_14755 [Solirubrobacterales bacterium 70-9]|nr:MAG: hypothetical protein BGO11_14755 [Solirubrobacterales bacterium 70-9]
MDGLVACEPELSLPPDEEELLPPEELGGLSATVAGPVDSAIAPDSVAPPCWLPPLFAVGAAATAPTLPAFWPPVFTAIPPSVLAVVVVPPAGSAFAGATAGCCGGELTSTIGHWWKTWAETSRTKTPIAMPIRVAPERAPTR